MSKINFISRLLDYTKSKKMVGEVILEDNEEDDSFDLLKELLSQPLSEEIKVDLVNRLECLYSRLDGLKSENRRLRRMLLRSQGILLPCGCLSTSHSPTYGGGGEGMVALMRSSSQLSERSSSGRVLRSSGPSSVAAGGGGAGGARTVRRPEPLRSRNGREPPVDVTFTKYPPLPGLQSQQQRTASPVRPKLLRERTYDVLEPIYVKGGSGREEKAKLPEIKKPVGAVKGDRRAPADSQSTSGRCRGSRMTAEVQRPLVPTVPAARRHVATPASPNLSSHEKSRVTRGSMKPAATEPRPPLSSKKKKENLKTREDFDPSALAPPSDIPTNVFWFPM